MSKEDAIKEYNKIFEKEYKKIGKPISLEM
jgi:hypothetical protein